MAGGPPTHKKSTSGEIELRSDASERFDAALKKLLNTPPKHVQKTTAATRERDGGAPKPTSKRAKPTVKG